MERKSSSSSCRRNSIGCMSAIFNLLSKHHKRSKFLSCGKVQQKEVAHELRLKEKDPKFPTRSPTLPVEMRRSSSVDVETRPHALVARLMGLDKFPLTPESSAGADKRSMKLQLAALEKCDEDLKALQRIIEVVKTRVSVGLGDNNELGRRRILQQQKQKLKKKPALEECITATGADFLDRFTTESVAYARINNHQEDNSFSALWRSKAKAMIHSVDEVCKDIAWGERREIGRIALALQHHICRDLIDEVVREISCYST